MPQAPAPKALPPPWPKQGMCRREYDVELAELEALL